MASRRILVTYKRKKQGKTDYGKRLTLLKSKKPRLVFRRSLKNLSMQIIEAKEKGDLTLISATSKELPKLGWKGYGRNLSAAYLVGLLCGIKAKEKGIKEAVLDSGLYVSKKGCLIYAALKGALDAGLKVPHSEIHFPTEARIKGEHLKKGADTFEKAKANILGGKK